MKHRSDANWTWLRKENFWILHHGDFGLNRIKDSASFGIHCCWSSLSYTYTLFMMFPEWELNTWLTLLWVERLICESIHSETSPIREVNISKNLIMLTSISWFVSLTNLLFEMEDDKNRVQIQLEVALTRKYARQRKTQFC